MFIGGKVKEPKRKEKAEGQMTSYSIPKNLEFNALNQNEVKMSVDVEQDLVIMQYLNQIRTVCLADMKVERIIENVPGRIECVGAYSDGIYGVTSDRRDFWMYVYYRDVVSQPTGVVLESRILAHKAYEYEGGSIIVTISADKFLRAYDVSNGGGTLLVEKQIYFLSQIEVDEISIYVMLKSKWICATLNQSTLIFVSIEDWHGTYPIAGEVFNISMITEYSHLNDNRETKWDDYGAIVWDDYTEDDNGKKHPLK